MIERYDKVYIESSKFLQNKSDGNGGSLNIKNSNDVEI